MKFIKKLVLISLSILLLATNISTLTINADDEEYKDTYSAYYEFVLDSNDTLPNELLDLLPENKSNLLKGDVIKNESINQTIEIDNVIYTFLNWSLDEVVVEDKDIYFVGTWTSSLKDTNDIVLSQEIIIENDLKKLSKPSIQTADTYNAIFQFVYLGVLNKTDFNQEILKLQPNPQIVEKGQEPLFEDFSNITIDNLVFDHWESGITSTISNEVIYFGVWKDSSTNTTLSIERPSTEPDAKTGDSQHIDISNMSDARHQYLDGDDAFCLEVHISGYANPGHSYWIVGGLDSRIAEIIWLGSRNGRSYCAIQAAIWNYLSGAVIYAYSDEETDPNSSSYNSNGKYECWGNTYDTYVTDQGPVQQLAKKGDVGCQLIPDPKGYAKVKKVSYNVSNVYDYSKLTNNYTLESAEYGLFKDPECTKQIGTFITDKDGNSNTIEVDEGIYYVKELKASKGYMLDTKVYSIIVDAGKTETVTSTEIPWNDPIRIKLFKQNARDKTRVKYLDKAEFTIKYYDTQSDDLTGLKAKYGWVFHPTYNDEGEAIVLLDEEHYVRGNDIPLNSKGEFYLPLGTFTIQETKAPQTYQIDPNIYIGHIYRKNDETIVEINGGEWLHVENRSLTQSEREVIVSTTALFDENREQRYVADGVAHIVDVVEFDYLIPGQEYVLKAKLMKVLEEEVLWTIEDLENGDCTKEQVGQVKEIIKTEDGLISEAEKTFVPANESGTVEVKFDGFNLDDKAGSTYVVYEYLYSAENTSKSIAYHKDIYDEGQTVKVDGLYKAAFVLYKISNDNRDIKLNGAYFMVNTKRIKRDGKTVKKDLGRFVTGGIYIEGKDNSTKFKVKVFKQGDNSSDLEYIKTYSSEYLKKFDVQAVTILDLEDGVYYTKIGDEEMVKWQVAKGAIFLPDQEEDTMITFKELIQPVGYLLDSKPFTMTVGHDYKVDRVENYRTNYYKPYNPVNTGVDD